jgi:hypothetical protein
MSFKLKKSRPNNSSLHLLTSSRKQKVDTPPNWLKETSTTMFSITHFMSLTWLNNKIKVNVSCKFISKKKMCQLLWEMNGLNIRCRSKNIYTSALMKCRPVTSNGASQLSCSDSSTRRTSSMKVLFNHVFPSTVISTSPSGRYVLSGTDPNAKTWIMVIQK